MNKKYSRFLFIAGLLMISVSLFALALPIATAQDEEPNPLGEPPTFLTGIYDAWAASPHARFEDDAFNHWNEDGAVSARCATCHSTPGYQDFLGADGTEAGVVDADAPLGTVVNCDACHNQAAASLNEVTFPSGAVVEGGETARCMVCHQGRSSGETVNAAIEEAGLTDEPNTVSEDFGFINIHYYAAAATLYGSEVSGGYEFEGNVYHMRTDHPAPLDTCIGCHSPHTLELDIDTCAECHEDVSAVEDLRDIRMAGSLVDYDGDGDIEEGISGEIATLQEMTYAAIQQYAAEVVGTPIVWANGYPYFFTDTDGDGVASEEEASYGNSYKTFTALLLQSTYNYQVVKKDPGGYAHNPEYHIQLLYDTIDELNQALDGGIDMAGLHRDSPGHFNTSSDAFRHWDEDGEVSARCSKCHTAEGLPFLLENGNTIDLPPSNSQTCTTCHANYQDFELLVVNEVEFPSGAVAGFGEEEPSNLCLNCHQGRESSLSISSAISRAGVGDDEVSDALRFINPHYFAAGATMFGTEVQGAYQFEGMEYNGLFEHTRRFDTCADCHNQHNLELRVDECSECHENVETRADLADIRAEADGVDAVDYDGDGDVTEGVAGVIEAWDQELLGYIETYAAETLGNPIVYNPDRYPYFFDEAGERYGTWTPTLLRAVYNYNYVGKDPGAYAHNADYTLQVLYDSLEAIGGPEAVANYTRPPVLEVED